MATVSRYECDGPGCVDTAPKAKGHQYPDLMLWNRLTIHTPQGTKVGAFHAPTCMVRWVAREVGMRWTDMASAPDVDAACTESVIRNDENVPCGAAIVDGVCTGRFHHVTSTSLVPGALGPD